MIQGADEQRYATASSPPAPASAYRDIFLEKDEAPPAPSLEKLLQRETKDEDALSLADFDGERKTQPL